MIKWLVVIAFGFLSLCEASTLIKRSAPLRHLELKSPITYITDCKDENGKGRLKARLATLFPGTSVQFVGVENDFEAALNLETDFYFGYNIRQVMASSQVDIVDAYDGRPGIILANVARREGGARRSKWDNGPPFSWLRLATVDIFATIDGYVHSLLQKMIGERLELEVFDIPTTVPHMGLSSERQEYIVHSQFRSYDYLPLLAHQLIGGRELPVSQRFAEVPAMPAALCWVDSFGNVKTNLLPEDAGFRVGREMVLRVDHLRQFTLPCYARLKEVPEDTVALIVGSSGLGGHRFLEIVQLGRSAAATLALRSGTEVRLEALAPASPPLES